MKRRTFIEGALIFAIIWGLTFFAVYQWAEQTAKAVL